MLHLRDGIVLLLRRCNKSNRICARSTVAIAHKKRTNCLKIYTINQLAIFTDRFGYRCKSFFFILFDLLSMQMRTYKFRLNVKRNKIFRHHSENSIWMHGNIDTFSYESYFHGMFIWWWHFEKGEKTFFFWKQNDINNWIISNWIHEIREKKTMWLWILLKIICIEKAIVYGEKTERKTETRMYNASDLNRRNSDQH